MRYSDIKKRIGYMGTYKVNVDLFDVERTLERYGRNYGLNLNPDFQRGHVWTERQQSRFIEFVLQGGLTGLDIFFNSPVFNNEQGEDIDTDEIVCVDGLQRLTAIRRFLRDEIPAFGLLRSEFEGNEPYIQLTFHINGLTRRRDILTWYVEMNEGGTPHADAEIKRVRALIEQC